MGSYRSLDALRVIVARYRTLGYTPAGGKLHPSQSDPAHDSYKRISRSAVGQHSDADAGEPGTLQI